MKKIIFLFSLFFVLGCKSKKGIEKPATITLEKVAPESVNEPQKKKATELGKQILMTCNTSKFKPFTENEATPSVIKNMTLNRLTKTCLKFRLKYGDFKDLKLVEVYQNHSENTTIYRYKALYEKKIANKELRVTMNQKSQIAAVKSEDWVDAFHYKVP
jgi:hypothetical protein